jgi:hypothetical protein
MSNDQYVAPKLLVINSPSGSNVPGAVNDPNVSGLPENFQINFNKLLYPKNTEIAVQQVSFTNSIYNITSANNTIGYRTTAGGATIWKTIPPGTYGLTDINTYLQAQMKADGNTGTDTNGNPIFYITIGVNLNTIQTTVTLSNSFALDLTQGSLWKYMGFSSAQLITFQGITTGTNYVDMFPINTILIHTNLIVGTYLNNTKSDIIFSVAQSVAPGYTQVTTPYQYLWLPLATLDIRSVYFYLTDQNNNPISLNGQPITLNLVFKY